MAPATVTAAPPAVVPASKAKKRKRRPADDDGGKHAETKSRKRRRAAGDDDDDLLDLQIGVNRAFASMDAQLLADHLSQQTGRFGADLSSVELSDLYISANAIRDTSSYEKDRTLQNLPDFLGAFSGKPGELGKAPKEKGAPHTIVVAGAGLRAADLVRALRSFQTKENTVAKLFAKHIKMEEAVDFLKTRRTGIGVGTPARLMDLLDNGALSVDHLQRLVVDASYIDQKKRGLMDMKDTMMPLARFLARKEFKGRYTDEEKQLALLFY